MLIKKSIRLDGHATSIAIEPEFWQALSDISVTRGQSVERLVIDIDKSRSPDDSLASAIRVFCLVFFKH